MDRINQHILIIDENSIDNMIHKNLLAQYGFEGEIKDLPCAEYAIVHIESRIKENLKLPDLIIQQVDFRNSNDFETMHRYLFYRKSLGHIRHVCMSCSDDPKFFTEIAELCEHIKIYTKPLNSSSFRELQLII